MNELNFQKALVDAAKKMGGWGHKMSHAQFVGIPDLFIAIPGYGQYIIECKWKKRGTWIIGKKISCPHPTEIQRVKLQRMRDAGVSVHVAVLFDNDPQYVFFTEELDRDWVIPSNTDFIRRKRGEPWANVMQEWLKRMQP